MKYNKNDIQYNDNLASEFAKKLVKACCDNLRVNAKGMEQFIELDEYYDLYPEICYYGKYKLTNDGQWLFSSFREIVQELIKEMEDEK